MSGPVDLRSVLEAGDLFVSYWLDHGLTVVVGDETGILGAETVPAYAVVDRIAAFEAEVQDPRRFARFFAESCRPASWPAGRGDGPSIVQVLASVGELITTPALRQALARGGYRRLLLFPDSALHATPVHLALEAVTGTPWHRTFPDGVVYAPSASAYVHACGKRLRKAPRRALVAIGDAADPDLVREAEAVAQRMPCPVDVIADRAGLERSAPTAELAYLAAHGEAVAGVAAPGRSCDASGWRLRFDGGALDPGDFYRERIRFPPGAAVILSACSLGRIVPGPLHELQGVVHALFYAGAAAVVAARWPIPSQTAEAVFGGLVDRVHGGERALGAALADAVRQAERLPALGALASSPDAAPFFWGPFALFGCGD